MYDKLIINGKIYSLDQDNNTYSWMGIKDDLIIGLGKGDYPETEGEVIDAGGQTILPGFINAHMHSLATGINAKSIDLSSANSIQEVLECIEKGCQESPQASLLYFEGLNIHRLAEQSPPSIEEIDAVSAGVPIFIRYMTGHGLIINTIAKERASIKDHMDEEEIFMKVQGLLSDEDIMAYIQSCADQCVACGTTSINSIIGGEVPEDRDCPIWIDEELKKRTLAVKVINFYQSKNPPAIKAMGLSRIGGCVCLDGTPVEGTAAFFEAYHDTPGNRGELYMSDSELYKIVSEAHELDMQCTFHAVGNRAVDQLLHVYNRVIEEQGPKGLRHRIEHCDLPSERHLQMAKKLGLVISVQPNITTMFGEFMVDSLGAERVKAMGHFRQMLDAGVHLAGGTDTPITPLTPLLTVHHAVNNPYPEKRLTVTEALKLFTINSAYANHKENQIGSLEIGKCADFVILSDDPYGCSEAIDQVEVLKTFVDGQCVYST